VLEDGEDWEALMELDHMEDWEELDHMEDWEELDHMEDWEELDHMEDWEELIQGLGPLVALVDITHFWEIDLVSRQQQN